MCAQSLLHSSSRHLYQTLAHATRDCDWHTCCHALISQLAPDVAGACNRLDRPHALTSTPAPILDQLQPLDACEAAFSPAVSFVLAAIPPPVEAIAHSCAGTHQLATWSLSRRSSCHAHLHPQSSAAFKTYTAVPDHAVEISPHHSRNISAGSMHYSSNTTGGREVGSSKHGNSSIDGDGAHASAASYMSSTKAAVELTQRIKSCNTLASLSNNIEQHSSRITVEHLSAAAAKLVHLPGQDSSSVGRAIVFTRLLQLLQPHTSNISCRTLATLLWAAAKIRYRQPEGWAQMLDVLAVDGFAKIQTGTPLGITRIFWALAKAHSSNMLTPVIGGLPVQSALDAVAQALADLLNPAHSQYPDIDVKNISLALYACSQLHCAPPELLGPLLREMTHRFREFDAHMVATSIWSLGKLDERALQLAQLSNARFDIPPPAQLQQRSLSSHSEPAGLGVALPAAASEEVDEVPDDSALTALLDQACEAVLHRVGADLEPQEWTMLISGLTSLRHINTHVLDAAAAAAIATLRSGNPAFPMCASITSWVCATCSYNSPSLHAILSAVRADADAARPHLSVANAINVLWSLTVLDLMDKEAHVAASLMSFINRQWDAAGGAAASIGMKRRGQDATHTFNDKSLLQLHVVLEELAACHHFGQLRGGSRTSGSCLVSLHPSLVHAVNVAVTAEAKPPSISRRQAHVISTLQSMKVDDPRMQLSGISGREAAAPTARYHAWPGLDDAPSSFNKVDLQIKDVLREVPMTADSKISTDLVVEMWDGRRIAVEVDGPQHYASNDSSWLMGGTQLRNRRLERVYGRGNVLVVRVLDWKVAADAKRHRKLLQDSLKRLIRG